MIRKVIIAGLLGGVVLIAWLFIVNGILGFKVMIDMKQIPNERQVYEVLKRNIVEPGRYICDPEVTSNGVFPVEEPVFSVLYGGVGHEAAGEQKLIKLLLFFIAPMVGAWMLSVTSPKIISSYVRRVFFFMMIGLLVAVFKDLFNFGIGDYPFSDAIIIGIYDIAAWTIVGLVVAWRIKPG